MSNDNPPVDHVIDEGPEPRAVEDNLKSRDTWIRLIFMVIYYMLVSIASIVASAVVVLSFLAVLFTGERNRQLMTAGETVANYIREIVSYLTYNTDDKPFPFGNDLPVPENND